MKDSYAIKATLLINLLLVPFDFFIAFAATYLLGNLPNDAAKLAEVAKIATLLLTVEGILLGLSPLVFERRRGKSGPIFVTVAAFALLWSLVTIIVGDTATNLTFMYPIYVFDLAFFQAVILANVLSAWSRPGERLG